MAFNEGQIRPPSFSAVIGIVVGLAVLVFASASVVVVSAGERAVVFDNFRGVLPDVRNEGMTFVLPFVQKAVRYDIKTQTYNLGTTDADASSAGASEAAIEARTADGQTVQIELSARFQPKEDEVWKLHQEVGQNYLYKIIVPEIRSVVRTIVAQYNVMDVYSAKRMLIQTQIDDALRKTFDKYYIRLNEVLIRNTRFSEEFQKAIEAKQVALQEAQRMDYVLQKESQEKKRKIIEAEGDAQSIRIRGQALAANPRLIQYEYVQKLTPGIKGVITDQQTIMNFTGLFEDKAGN
ncbi:MAG: protease [Candidatus Melainabacteria bacterium HGW-Melainabacteria-1]|nr:MAG: protease [Candidatus Melainabacteria bacterium HGW-Melainabacteria-1]